MVLKSSCSVIFSKEMEVVSSNPLLAPNESNSNFFSSVLILSSSDAVRYVNNKKRKINKKNIFFNGIRNNRLFLQMNNKSNLLTI